MSREPYARKSVFCGATAESGETCNRPRGHTSPHRGGRTGMPWPNNVALDDDLPAPRGAPGGEPDDNPICINCGSRKEFHVPSSLGLACRYVSTHFAPRRIGAQSPSALGLLDGEAVVKYLWAALSGEGGASDFEDTRALRVALSHYVVAAPRGAPGDPPEPVEPYGAVDLDEGCGACATTMRKYCPNCDTLYSQPVRPDAARTAVARQTGGTAE